MKTNKTIDELQCEKIQLEIKDLNRPWYKRKDYLQILLPTTVALMTLIYALVTGFFNTKYDLLQLQKETLNLEVVRFEEKRNELIETNNFLSSLNDSLLSSLSDERKSIQYLHDELQMKQREIIEREFQLTQLRSRKVYYEEEIKALETDFNKRRQLIGYTGLC